ncbi:uncharacterized protein J4E88_000200 [Alternaria novae-zelandiae]|uniref:uncharacterized protein n=1 Tax=Alternaria novae-zelandiae TaxID=430562 RepID=UPI0020C390D9|nr:uncharacterized protein J4E88_000200 [Alternaria novae-zelandiae]KAI4696029.1 hypothetical protein J4E88_000200 [Alternaria novae-zelandiae]
MGIREEDEDKKFRWVLYGRALAYLSKLAFGGCVILVFRQRMWRAFRSRAFTVLSIDQIFGATEDPSIFGNWEALSSAPVLCAIALNISLIKDAGLQVIWLVPLATIIFSPGALTFGTYLDSETIDLNVPTLNFSMESTKDWRHPVKLADGSNKRSMMYYNTTDLSGTAPGWFDYYDQPSAELRRVALLLAYSNVDRPNIRQDARQDACGGRFNCTYEQSFVGPSYQCEEIASGADDDERLTELGAPFNMSILAPRGRFVYYADVDEGEYARPQADNFRKGSGGIPDGEIPVDLGVFKSEPALWIGYAFNSTVKLAEDDPLAKNWTHRYDARIMRCLHVETKYTVSWNFTEPFFNSTVKLEPQRLIIDASFPRGVDGKTNYTIAPGPAENYVSPRDDVGLYKKTAAYHAVGDMFRNFLRGHVDLEPPLPGPYYAQVYSDVTKTRLVEKNSEPKQNLTDEIETFYSDMVLSLLSAPEMLAVAEEQRTVNRSRLQSSFVYVPERLWQCYAPVIFITLLILLFGAFTIWQDGTTFSTGFSRILVTTRNTTLDDISRGACLGNDPFPLELMHTRLKFGVLANSNDPEYMREHGYQGIGDFQSVNHCAFGVASEIAPIVRGAPYAGLTKRRNGQVPIKSEMEDE